MCGIFGIVTNQKISVGKYALAGVKRLEYRGYDSCGIVAQFDSKLLVKKDAGKIDQIHQKLRLDDFLVRYFGFLSYCMQTHHNASP